MRSGLLVGISIPGSFLSWLLVLYILGFTINIVVLFDGDQAGKNASIRLFEKLLPIIKTDNVFRFVFLPQNLDPEEYLKKFGKKHFNLLLEKSYNISDIILNLLNSYSLSFLLFLQ